MAAARTAIHMRARVIAVAPDSRRARRNRPSASHGSTRGSLPSSRFDSRHTASCRTPGSLLVPAVSNSQRTGRGIDAKSVLKPLRMTK